jgi:hypothetical protein
LHFSSPGKGNVFPLSGDSRASLRLDSHRQTRIGRNTWWLNSLKRNDPRQNRRTQPPTPGGISPFRRHPVAPRPEPRRSCQPKLSSPDSPRTPRSGTCSNSRAPFRRYAPLPAECRSSGRSAGSWRGVRESGGGTLRSGLPFRCAKLHLQKCCCRVLYAPPICDVNVTA